MESSPQISESSKPVHAKAFIAVRLKPLGAGKSDLISEYVDEKWISKRIK